jgi:hypothetical protein
MNSDASPSQVDPVDGLAEQFVHRLRRGERPTPAEYAALYPEHARWDRSLIRQRFRSFERQRGGCASPPWRSRRAH